MLPWTYRIQNTHQHVDPSSSVSSRSWWCDNSIASPGVREWVKKKKKRRRAGVYPGCASVLVIKKSRIDSTSPSITFIPHPHRNSA